MLNNQSVLIVEEEFLIALDIRQVLEDAGAKDFASALTAAEALRMGDCLATHALAVIEMPLGDDQAVALYNTLRGHSVPIVISSADGMYRHEIPGGVAAPVVIKPFSSEELLAACQKAMGGAR